MGGRKRVVQRSVTELSLRTKDALTRQGLLGRTAHGMNNVLMEARFASKFSGKKTLIRSTKSETNIRRNAGLAFNTGGRFALPSRMRRVMPEKWLFRVGDRVACVHKKAKHMVKVDTDEDEDKWEKQKILYAEGVVTAVDYARMELKVAGLNAQKVPWSADPEELPVSYYVLALIDPVTGKPTPAQWKDGQRVTLHGNVVPLPEKDFFLRLHEVPKEFNRELDEVETSESVVRNGIDGGFQPRPLPAYVRPEMLTERYHHLLHPSVAPA
ncbi:MAG: hypothetical protein MHM6MM_007347 [Cercozoa sp. M6MM]